jgi:F0F1-type ATP synthase assembly protein I
MGYLLIGAGIWMIVYSLNLSPWFLFGLVLIGLGLACLED